MAVLFCWFAWYILYGIECYMNGIGLNPECRNQFLFPFYGLKQDIVWLFYPIEDGPGIIHFLIMHVGFILCPLLLFWI